MGRLSHIDWDAQPLGQVIDRAIAAALGCSTVTVFKARHARGIKACGRDVIAGMSVGVMSDPETAAAYGVSVDTVARKRRKNGIPPHCQDRVNKGINWDMQHLGDVPDAQIARAHGCSREAVRAARKRRGIPSVESQKAREAKP